MYNSCVQMEDLFSSLHPLRQTDKTSLCVSESKFVLTFPQAKLILQTHIQTHKHYSFRPSFIFPLIIEAGKQIMENYCDFYKEIKVIYCFEQYYRADCSPVI